MAFRNLPSDRRAIQSKLASPATLASRPASPEPIGKLPDTAVVFESDAFDYWMHQGRAEP